MPTRSLPRLRPSKLQAEHYPASFDVARSLTDVNTLVVIEVFEDREAFQRQNAQAEVAAVLQLVEAGALASDLEWAMWEGAKVE
jgi:quinol monooxygenase YgiN